MWLAKVRFSAKMTPKIACWRSVRHGRCELLEIGRRSRLIFLIARGVQYNESSCFGRVQASVDRV